MDVEIDPTANDVSLLGGDIVVASVSQPGHGVAVLNGDGTCDLYA